MQQNEEKRLWNNAGGKSQRATETEEDSSSQLGLKNLVKFIYSISGGGKLPLLMRCLSHLVLHQGSTQEPTNKTGLVACTT